MNIFTGKESDSKVNVHDARKLGEELMKSFRLKLPEGFRDKISSTVITMATPKEERKENVVNNNLNTELILSCVVYLVGN